MNFVAEVPAHMPKSTLHVWPTQSSFDFVACSTSEPTALTQAAGVPPQSENGWLTTSWVTECVIQSMTRDPQKSVHFIDFSFYNI